MIFSETKLKGAYVIDLEKLDDKRGFFARTWDKKIFEEKGLNNNLVQCNISFNKYKGTIRGMHFQTPPYEEAKLVRCIRGSAFEVMVDLRSDSKTFNQWSGIEINSKNYRMLYAPEGFALGFQTLEDNTELFYQISQVYAPDYARGFRWDDPAFRILWPLKVSVISQRDLSFKSFEQQVSEY